MGNPKAFLHLSTQNDLLLSVRLHSYTHSLPSLYQILHHLRPFAIPAGGPSLVGRFVGLLVYLEYLGQVAGVPWST